MSIHPFRPHFHLELPLSKQDALVRLTNGLNAPESTVEAMVVGDHIEFMIPKVDRHYWSPRLSIELSEKESDGKSQSNLHCLFGPRPAVWTLFAACYSLFAFIGVTAILFASAQYLIGHSMWALWLLPVAIGGAILGYAVSKVGQKLAADEMRFLHGYLHSQLGVVSISNGQAQLKSAIESV